MKKSKQIKIDGQLAHLLQDDDFDCFTVIGLKNAYQKAALTPLNNADAHKFIYRQLLRLTKLGLLEKTGQKNTREVIYKKTNFIANVSFIANALVKTPVDLGGTYDRVIALGKAPSIEDKLKAYQVDMMSAIGEAEEYICLLEQFPEMKEQLKKQYHLARDRSSKLLGKIKAINTVSTLKMQSH